MILPPVPSVGDIYDISVLVRYTRVEMRAHDVHLLHPPLCLNEHSREKCSPPTLVGVATRANDFRSHDEARNVGHEQRAAEEQWIEGGAHK